MPVGIRGRNASPAADGEATKYKPSPAKFDQHVGISMTLPLPRSSNIAEGWQLGLKSLVYQSYSLDPP